MGRPRQPGGPHAEGSGVLTRESNPDQMGKNLFYPRATHPCVLACAKEGAAPPRSPGRSKPGQQGDFALPLRRRGSKARGGGREPAVKATNPIGVFPFHST
jgi:hypothetical protein